MEVSDSVKTNQKLQQSVPRQLAVKILNGVQINAIFFQRQVSKGKAIHWFIETMLLYCSYLQATVKLEHRNHLFPDVSAKLSTPVTD